MVKINEIWPTTRYAGPIANDGEAERVARALKGQRSGKGWVAKCPAHDDHKSSLSISEGKDGRLLLNCFAGCGFTDILDVLRDRGIVGTDRLERGRRALAYVAPAPTEHKLDPRAAWLWSESVPLHGTPAQVYLERRGILIMPPSLRYCADPRAMIAGFRRPDGKLVAVQVTFITKDGEKDEKVTGRPPRLTYGNMRDGAVRLAAAADVMGLAEGTETGLSAMAMAGMPVWVALGGRRMHDVALPDFVREVHVFGDNGGPGRDAAHRTADVHLKAGRTVELRFPPDGIGDYNDLVRAHADCDGDNERLMANLQAATVAPKIGSAAA